jgi:hypothetical protein
MSFPHGTFDEGDPMSAKTVRAATVSVVVAAFAVGGVLITSSAASAQPKTSGPKGCSVFHAETGTSEEVADGTLIIAASGSIYQCKDGQWVKVPDRIVINAQALAVTTSQATFG